MFDAHVWLRNVKDAARLVEADKLFIQARRLSAQSLAAPVGVAGRGGAHDKLQAIDVAIDLEATRKQRLEHALAEIAEARSVFEGMRQVGQLEREAANVLELTHIFLCTQKDAAERLYISHATLKRRANYGIDWLNAHGLAHAKNSLGSAT